MKIDDNILRNQDLDIFFKSNFQGQILPIHCATFGALLPEELNDDKYIYDCISYIRDIEMVLDVDDIEILTENVIRILGQDNAENPILRDRLLSPQERIEEYVSTFRVMARKGFYSFDKLHCPNELPDIDNSFDYLLIAKPKEENKILFHYHRDFIIHHDLEILKECNSLDLRYR